MKFFKTITNKNHVTLIGNMLYQNKLLSIKAKLGHKRSMRQLIGLGMKSHSGKMSPGEVEELIKYFLNIK